MSFTKIAGAKLANHSSDTLCSPNNCHHHLVSSSNKLLKHFILGIHAPSTTKLRNDTEINRAQKICHNTGGEQSF